MKRAGRRIPWESAALLVVGFAVFAAGRWLAEGATARTAIQILGAAALLIAPVIWRAEGSIIIGLRGISLNLREGIRSKAVMSALGATEQQLEAILQVTKTPHRALASILPFLSGDVATEIITVPMELEGATLLDKRLSFIRKDLQVSAVALRHPGQQWRAGGGVSTDPFKAGTELLVCGPPESLARLTERLRSTNAPTMTHRTPGPDAGSNLPKG